MNSAIGLLQMLPWQRKSILIMFCMLQFAFFAFSIARNLQFVEMDFQMSPCRDIALEVCLRPAELPGGTQIPAPFIQVQLCLQNDYILRPADFHGQLQQYGACCGAKVLQRAPPISARRTKQDGKSGSAGVGNTVRPGPPKRSGHARRLLEPAWRRIFM